VPDQAAPAPAASEDARGAFAALLAQNGLLIPTATPGVYGRGAVFARVVEAVGALVGRLAPPGADSMELPPVMGRAGFQATGYLAKFPHLAGVVQCFCGDDDGHARLLNAVAAGGDWTGALSSSEVVLTPAACYPVYAVVAARGPLPADGLILDVSSWCFRHEPSRHPERMLAFRQREQVCFGTAAQVEQFRAAWETRALAMFRALRLPAEYEPAQDPFFGRLGSLVAEGQRARRLKYEILVPIADPARPDACGSFNLHGDHFARAFGLRTAGGGTARTACAGFGLERLALALFRHHGLRPEAWPADVQETLRHQQ
jgi:seryl-tRNA synthetase